MSEARRQLVRRWPLWRSASHLAWWSLGVAPFACMSLLLCLLGTTPPEGTQFPWRALLAAGVVGLVVTLLSAVAWLREQTQGIPALLESLLLALPPSYFPTLVLSMWVQRLPLEQLLVPKAFALWGTIYATCAIVICLLRQFELRFLARLAATLAEETESRGEAAP